eukprot:COSAG02_NODE_5643_length_4159_cov_7.496798_3_plen_119_part_00
MAFLTPTCASLRKWHTSNHSLDSLTRQASTPLQKDLKSLGVQPAACKASWWLPAQNSHAASPCGCIHGVVVHPAGRSVVWFVLQALLHIGKWGKAQRGGRGASVRATSRLNMRSLEVS